MKTSTTTSNARSATGRMAAVQEMAAFQRMLFEVEREFVRCATALVPRVGEIELKYLLCQHVWESAGHARFLRERGREMSGFGKGETVRESFRSIFEEALRPEDPMVSLAGFYKVIKPAILQAYRDYIEATHQLADWPSRHLVEEFILDEVRHAEEIVPYLANVEAAEWVDHLSSAMAALGGWLGNEPRTTLPADYTWVYQESEYTHPEVCNRGNYPVCSSVFGHDPEADPIVRPWLEDKKTDAKVIRLMVYVWLMMELDAVDYLATVFYDTPEAPFDLHFDLARHLWDESRHSQFGYRQLPGLGVDLNTVEHSLELYNTLIHMSPPERYAMMTMEFEAGSFPTKALVMDRVRELNDFEADTLLAFDRNDEQNHVRYGHRWLPEIMKLFNDERTVDEFVEETKKHFNELMAIHGTKTPHSLSKEERLTGNKILELAGVA
ncbi:MAG: DUF455 family protein [Puniceicoccaceae bacterium]